LGLPLYLSLAEALHLSDKVLSEELEKHTFKPRVRSDFMGGLKSGVNGTPTFFINGRRHDAAVDAGRDVRLTAGPRNARHNSMTIAAEVKRFCHRINMYTQGLLGA
jgi:hypothetical protein